MFVDSVRDYYRMSARSVLRHAALSTLSSLNTRVGSTREGLSRPRVHILCLHSVFADEVRGFRNLLDAVARDHSFISYSAACQRIRQGQYDGRYMAFSFDDGMKNNLRAAEILVDYGASACFFVCTEFVGETDPNRLQEFCRSRLHSPPVELLSWSDIDTLKQRGHEIGSHTRAHLNLALIDHQRLEDEIEGSRSDLLEAVGECRHFAWPYGRFAEAPVGLGQLVQGAGYESCASAVRGCHTVVSASNLCLRREPIVVGAPLAHNLFFIARSATTSSEADNAWPESLLARVPGG